MKIKRIEHIAIATERLDDGLALFGHAFGLAPEYVEELPQARLAMLPVGETYIELLEGTQPESRTSRWMAERGPGLFHICFEVEDIREAIAELSAKGIRFMADGPSPGHGGSQIIFLDPRCTGGVSIELAELPATTGALGTEGFIEVKDAS